MLVFWAFNIIITLYIEFQSPNRCTFTDIYANQDAKLNQVALLGHLKDRTDRNRTFSTFQVKEYLNCASL